MHCAKGIVRFAEVCSPVCKPHFRHVNLALARARGVLHSLSARKDYLLPGADARRDIEIALSDLRSRFGTDPGWRPYIEALSDRTDERLSEPQETLTLHEQGRAEAARELFLTDIGWEKMQAVRQSALALASIARRQADVERARLVATMGLGRIGVHATMALSLLWFIYYLRKSAALQQEQRLHANDLQRESARLESEVKVRTQELRGMALALAPTQLLSGQRAREMEQSQYWRGSAGDFVWCRFEV